jgi:hypothetical protein
MARTSFPALIAGCFGIAWFAILLIAPRAEAQAISTVSGTAVANEIDADEDGTTGSTQIAEGQGPFGKALHRSHAELAPWDGSFCGDSSIQLVYTVFSSARTYTNGDQLYVSLSDGTLCFNLVDGSFTAHVNLNVTGGTGRFEGATGSVAVSTSGQTLQVDTVPSRLAFGAFSGTSIDEIVLAH